VSPVQQAAETSGAAAVERQPPPPRLFQVVFSRPSLSRCVPIALFVGTVLSLINQGSVIFGGHATWVTWLRVAFNYVVPFCVSSSGFFASQRSMWRASVPSRSTTGESPVRSTTVDGVPSSDPLAHT